MREFVDEDDIVGYPPFRGLVTVEIEQRFARHRRALFAYDQQERAFAPFRLTHADDRRLRHRRMTDRDVLELDRSDPFAPRLDHVLAAIRDLQIAVCIERADVAGRHPSVRRQRIAPFVSKIFPQNPWTFAQTVAGRLTVTGTLAAFRVDDFHIDTIKWTSLL